jgi:hypothetical protein
MEKLFTGVLKIMAGVCVVLFVLAVGIALLLFNAEQRLFNADLYLRALETQNIYDRLPILAAESLASSPVNNNTNNPSAYINFPPTQNWESVFRALLPADLSKSMTEQAVTSVFDYLNGRSEIVTLSMVDFKTHLTGPAGTNALLQVLHAQPDCTFEQITQFTLDSLFGGSSSLVLCNPPDELLVLFEPLMQAQLQGIASTIPDLVDLTPSAASTENPLQGLRAVRAVMRFSPLLPFGLLFLVTVFAVRDLKDWLDWWGIPLLAGGLFGLTLAAAISPLFKWAFTTYAVPRIPAYLPASLTETIRELTSSVLAGVAAPIVFQSVLLVLLGIVMILATRIRKPATPPLQPRDRFGESPDERI